MKSSNSVTNGKNVDTSTIEVVRIRPFSDSPISDFSLPLTFFDTYWLKLHPVEIIFYYKLTQSTPSYFNSVILPKLKHSLSHALTHFLPIAGNLVWPPNSSVPIILYTSNDAVSLTVAESSKDFHRLSSHQTRGAAESLPYIPELEVTESKASVLSLKITNFPNQGFCIGISIHKAVMDGNSLTMFVKAWAQLTKQATQLSLDLIPFYDRSSIPDPDGAAVHFLNRLPNLDTNPRSLNLIRINPPDQELVQSTFEFSAQDIKKLREKMLSRLHLYLHQPIHLSDLVVTLAYTLFCRVKMKKQEESGNKRVTEFRLPVDCRGRLGRPLPAKYFGNCIGVYEMASVKEALVMEDGDDGLALAMVAKGIYDTIVGLQDRAVEKAIRDFKKRYELPAGSEVIGIAGSPRFELYGSDFGWGRPVKVEYTSIARVGAISMADSGNGNRGIEVGLALKKREMDIFQNLFGNGLARCSL